MHHTNFPNSFFYSKRKVPSQNFVAIFRHSDIVELDVINRVATLAILFYPTSDSCRMLISQEFPAKALPPKGEGFDQ